MKKITLALAIAVTSVLLVSQSCSKKGSSAPNCKLITIVDAVGSTATTVNITYNNDGKISTMQQTGSNPSSKVYTYIGNLMMISTSVSGSLQSTDSVILNSDGTIAYSLTRDVSSNVAINTYTYSGGQIQKSTYQYDGGAITTTTYQYTNGDMTSSSDGTSTSTYTYYTDKSFQDGDYFKLVQIINYGGLYIKNAHLIKGFQQGSTVENFNYTFDNTGKVTGATATNGSSVENVTLQYNCN
jgi:hypothetical protein